MAALTVISIYVVVAIATAVFLMLRRQWHGAAALSQPLLNGLLWPFLLPALVRAPVATSAPSGTPRSRSLEKIAHVLQDAWPVADASGLRPESRERERTLAFLSRLRALDGRLGEMEQAMATAPASLRDRLGRLRDRTVLEFDQGLALLEELSGQLMLLRFTSVGESIEREHVEALLARIGALAEVSVPDVDRG